MVTMHKIKKTNYLKRLYRGIGASVCPGLTGLQNIGNTCYMNAALQALSNTPPLTQFFLACSVTALNSSEPGKKPPTLSRSYHRLMQELWHRKRPGYVAPTGILYGIRNVSLYFTVSCQEISVCVCYFITHYSLFTYVLLKSQSYIVMLLFFLS